jgi:hypothetical protein
MEIRVPTDRLMDLMINGGGLTITKKFTTLRISKLLFLVATQPTW